MSDSVVLSMILLCDTRSIILSIVYTYRQIGSVSHCDDVHGCVYVGG